MKITSYLVISMLLITCKSVNKEILTTSSKNNNLTISEVSEKLFPANTNINFYMSKGKVKFQDSDNLYNANFQIRLKPDSAAWFQISFLGFTIFNGIFTEDSLKLINRRERTVHLLSNDEARKLIGAKITLDNIESILTGIPIISKKKLKLCSFSTHDKNSIVCKKFKKYHSSVLEYNIRYNSSLWKLFGQYFAIKKDEKVNVHYNEYLKGLPKNIKIEVHKKQNFSKVLLNIREIELNRIYKMPFKIPSQWQPK